MVEFNPNQACLWQKLKNLNLSRFALRPHRHLTAAAPRFISADLTLQHFVSISGTAGNSIWTPRLWNNIILLESMADVDAFASLWHESISISTRCCFPGSLKQLQQHQQLFLLQLLLKLQLSFSNYFPLASSYCSLLTIKSTFRFVTSPSRSFFAKSAPAASPCPGSVEIFQTIFLLLARELVGSKNREGSRQKLVLQSVFLLRSLRGIISSLGCCSRNSFLTWLKLRLTEEQRRPGRKGDGAGREQF